jgi:hypothetical protein
MTELDIDRILFLPRSLARLRTLIPRIGIVAVKDILRASPLIHADTFVDATGRRHYEGNAYFLWTDRIHGQHVLVVNPDRDREGCWAMSDIVRLDERIAAPTADYEVTA